MEIRPIVQAVLILVAIVLIFVAVAHCQTVACMGHSDCRVQYQYVARDFPGLTWVANGHDSARLNQLLAWEQFDIMFIQKELGGCPDYFEILVGTTDVELQGLPGNRNYTSPTVFIQELQQYIGVVLAACPLSTVILPNVPGFNHAVLLPPASYDQGIAQRVMVYNQYESYQVFPSQVATVDIWTPLTMPNGWAWPQLIPYIDPDGSGWAAADARIAQVIH